MGRRLVHLLKSDAEYELFGLARSASAASNLEAMGVQPVHANLTDIDSLRAALSGMELDVVFHLAAEIASQRSRKRLREVNVLGTQNLFEVLKDTPSLHKFIFVSTVVTGEAHGEILEESKPLQVDTEYGRSKQESEKMLLAAFSASGFPVLISRPGHIYGNGGWVKGIAVQIRQGRARIPGTGENLWDVAHVDDVASSLLILMKKGVPGEIYHVADDCSVTMRDFFDELSRILGVRPVGQMPRFIANWLIGKDTINSVVRSARTSNKKLKALGWQPAYPDFKTGLAEAFSTKK